MSSKTVRTKPCFCDSFLAGISRAEGTVGNKALHGITMHYNVPCTKHFQDGKVLASWSIVMQAYGVDMQARDCQWTCEKRIAYELPMKSEPPKSIQVLMTHMTTLWQHHDNHYIIIHHCIIASLHLHVRFREVMQRWMVFDSFWATQHNSTYSTMRQDDPMFSEFKFIAKLWIEKPDVIYSYLLYEMKTSFNYCRSKDVSSASMSYGKSWWMGSHGSTMTKPQIQQIDWSNLSP